MRSGLRRGLAEEKRIGVNPYKFGMIGSTDAHSGLATAAEDNFGGKLARGSIPAANAEPSLGSINGWDMSASGLAAVWAEANTRTSILRAFKRREVYSTTGPRMSLRLFGGYEFSDQDAQASDLASLGYSKGVPMGADLGRAPQKRRLFGGDSIVAPQLLIRAVKEAGGANLDRVQMVKSWLDQAGNSHERVYNVAWSDDRQLDAAGKLTSVGDTVDRQTGKVDNRIGSAELSTLWQDPDFSVDQRVFYYVRVLPIPTARHSTLDMLALGRNPEAQQDYPVTIQERAYSSPIWYNP